MERAYEILQLARATAPEEERNKLNSAESDRGEASIKATSEMPSGRKKEANKTYSNFKCVITDCEGDVSCEGSSVCTNLFSALSSDEYVPNVNE